MDALRVLNAFNAAHSASVDIVSRMKRNAIAWTEPPERKPGRAGRSRKKGDKVRLWELFETKWAEFTKENVKIRGKDTVETRDDPVNGSFKHFPGAGDGSDYPTSIKMTLEQLECGGLFAFNTAIANGAEMIMTSATTFPLIDEKVCMADGETKGYYPATLSPKIVMHMLREGLAFDGVIITDALEMEQFVIEPTIERHCFQEAAALSNMTFR